MPARFRSEEGENSPSFTLIRAFVRIGSHPRLTVRIIERDGDDGLLQGGRLLDPGAAERDTLQSHQLSANRTIRHPSAISPASAILSTWRPQGSVTQASL